MSDENVEKLAEFDAPYRRKVLLGEVEFDSGMKLLRLTLREGHRITIVDLDAETANGIAAAMSTWAENAGGD
ncbi:MAG: hypothetical protein KDJ16_18490 [Hyphomicrobiales bacterium]|nr:hypothetical protein [Hyphomicrobiales bacterium]